MILNNEDDDDPKHKKRKFNKITVCIPEADPDPNQRRGRRGGRDYIRGRGRGGRDYIRGGRRGGRSYLRGGSCPP